MCGRYAFGEAQLIQHQIERSQLAIEEVRAGRQSTIQYNVSPGRWGPVYRHESSNLDSTNPDTRDSATRPDSNHDNSHSSDNSHSGRTEKGYRGVVDWMKWGLVPRYSKEMGNIGYTFNCRADSLANNSKMWNAPKQRQRCIVLAQGYFEWKKTDNKKIPHYIKRKDGKLMLLAGLWDVNKHIDKEGLYTYTVVTTDAHKGMEWLHSRMPVILDEADTEAINKWLDPKYVWNQHSSELLAMLKPFDSSRLDIYQVSSDVGKLSNDYEGLTKPLKESKRLITSFFGGKSKGDKVKEDKSGLKKEPIKEEEDEVENGEEQRGSLKEERDEVKDEEEQKASVKKQGEQRDSVKEETAAADKSELSQSPPRKREPPRPAPSPKKKQRKLDDNQKSITSFFS